MQTDPHCVFCKIILGQLPATRHFEDDQCIVIEDIQPSAKTHLLVIPKKHISTLDAAFAENPRFGAEILGTLYDRATQAARKLNLVANGYRTVINVNSWGGQVVFHLHLHLLGGERLGPLGSGSQRPI